MKFLSGWKTYIVSVGAIITAIGSYLNGAIDLSQLVEAIFLAIGAMTIRNGITTDISKATDKKI